MLQGLRLSKKFNLILLFVFLGAVLLSGVIFSSILTQRAEYQVTTRANLLMQTMLSVRQYTLEEITPELTARLETETEFLPQTVPGYSARGVVDRLRNSPEYKDFFYKEATLNPTNLRDKADEFESGIINQFRSNAARRELTGYRTSSVGDLFYIARPIAISQESCLRCHSTPQAAPKSLLTTYGSDNGFGWKLNEIVGAQMISVPTAGLVESARRDALLFVGLMAVAFAIVLLIVNFLLKRVVINPLNRISTAANEVSMGNMAAEFPAEGKDEIGKLAAAFNRMKTSLMMAMEMLKQGL
jgi:HAMP domain-containing protein